MPGLPIQSGQNCIGINMKIKISKIAKILAFSALAFSGMAHANQKDSAVSVVEYDKPIELNGRIKFAHANHLSSPDQSKPERYLYIHLDRGISAFPSNDRDDENSTARHQYDITLKAKTSKIISEMEKNIESQVILTGKLSAGLPHSSGATDLVFVVESIK